MLELERFARQKLDRAARQEQVARLVSLTQPDKPSPTEQDWINAARSLVVNGKQCHPANLYAVRRVESGGAAFNAEGRLVIAYETHVFSRNSAPKHGYDKSHPHLSTRRWQNYRKVAPSERHRHPMGMTQEGRWMLLAEAAELDFFAATSACSYGMWQIMGEGYKPMGFASPMHMIEVMYEGYEGQWECFLRFCRWKGALPALVNGDWMTFASLYNGTGQPGHYARLLENAAKDGRIQLA